MTNKILIVDDEENIVISIEFLMTQAGYTTEIARDGAEALQKTETFKPDLILLDVMMPKINGFEVCRRIRDNSDKFNNPKIIMLTAKGREVEVTKGLAMGADNYIIKPFSTRELVVEVKRTLGGEV
jgi:DNA-binding response OmpR family regulator